MKFIKEFLKLFISLTVIFTLGAYAFFVFTLPVVLSSVDNVSKLEDFLSKKVNAPVSIKNLEVKTHPNLGFDIYVRGIYIIPRNDGDLFHADNLKYSANIFNLKHGKFDADYIYANVGLLKKYIKIEKKSDSNYLDLSFYPQINIKKAYIKYNDSTYTEIENISSNKYGDKIITKLLAKTYSPYTKEPIVLGSAGVIVFKDRLGFDSFSVKTGFSQLFLSGDSTGMWIKGNKLPVAELEKTFLHIYKIKHPKKRNFIENFSDFKGVIDIDLFANKDGMTGSCTTYDLAAKFSNFKIPVSFPKTVFKFEGREISANAKGTFGTGPVETNFYLSGLLTKNLHVWGDVYSVLTNKFAQGYYPAVTVKGSAPATVKYHTHNEKTDVYYTLQVNKNNNIESKWGNLDNTDKNRILSMHTAKHGDPIKVESWDYSIGETGKKSKILYGDGNFEKVNGHYKLSDLSIKTNGKVSVNYIKSFIRNYVENGSFDADMKFGIFSDTAIGYINLYDISHKDFLYLKEANITSDEDATKFKADGTFYSSPIKIKASVSNRISNDILVQDVDIRLKEFFLQKGKIESIPASFKTGKAKPKKTHKKRVKYTVEHGNVVVDRLYGNKFDVRNVNIQGSLKDDIADFVMPKADYANGLLSAKGFYNLKNHSSNIQFFASDIDSNIVVTNFFKLPDQFTGDAFATLHVISKDKFNDIKASATFAISDGYMPKLAQQEFYLGDKNKKIDNRYKYTLSKIINLDFSKKRDLSANIYGSFNLDNDVLKDLRMFAKSDWIGLYFEGNYDSCSQATNLRIYGKRNKTWAKGIRIFKIPLNLIYSLVFKPEHTAQQYQDKLKLVPEISAAATDKVSIFRVSVLGYFGRKNGLKIEMKDLR